MQELNLLLVTMHRSHFVVANRLLLLELQRLRFRQHSLDVRRGEPKDADRTGDILNRLLAEISEGDREHDTGFDHSPRVRCTGHPARRRVCRRAAMLTPSPKIYRRRR